MREAPPNAPAPALDPRSDDELMQLSAAGARDAFAVLVRRHQARVRAYCARFCGSAALGDDLAQDSFVEVWRKAKSYDARGSFKAYLFHVAANRCKNQRRGDQRLRASAEADAEDRARLEQGPSSDLFALRERYGQLQAGVSKLPELQREAVLLRYSAELDYAEIAELLSVPEPTARSRVFLGLMKLRRLLCAELPR